MLQQFTFPEEGRTGVEELYLKIFGDARRNGKKIQLMQKASLQTDTYFNGFFSEEWRKYTDLSKIGCTVEVQGNCIVEVFAVKKKGNGKKEQVLKRQHYQSKERGKVRFSFSLSELSGMIAVRVIAVKNTLFYGGTWEYKKCLEDGGLEKTIQIALVICTYHKEKELLRNLDYLQKTVLKNFKSPLFGKIHIYIVDNGRTISLQDQNIQVIANRNTGGSGGFARGMEEAVKEKERYGFSHILLMDDDVIIEKSSLEKTLALLYCIKEEYRQSFIGGAMLRQDYPWIQHEAGGIWKDGRLKAIGQRQDLRRTEVLLQNRKKKEKPNYAAWWYCCIPLQYVEKNGYPMPFFLHFDDVEYSLRGKQEPIYLHGIGIWHEQFEQKRGSALVYYDMRNTLFTYCMYGDMRKKWKIWKLVLYEWYQAVSRYRYKEIELIFKAVKDYKKGIVWLQKADAEELHKIICRMGYQWKRQEQIKDFEKEVQKEELYKNSESVWKRIWRIFTINGNIFSAKRGTGYLPLGASLDRFYRLKRVYLYDPSTGLGEWVEKDWIELVKGCKRGIEMIVLLFKKKG